MIQTKIRASFDLWMKIDKKVTFYNFVRYSIAAWYKKNGRTLIKVTINPIDLPKLANAKGVIFQGNKYPLETSKYCLPDHVQFH